uniref:Amino acid transporter transmembrane domain-containing protein n=1 Tax=Lotharella globosa TaxID=91324 RepID=A0A7S3Z3P5_9EUKA
MSNPLASSSTDSKELGENNGTLNSSSGPSFMFSGPAATFSRITSTLRIPAGSLRSSVFTLVTSTVGSGVLSLPYAFSSTGVLPTVFFVFFGAFIAYFSIWILLTCSAHSSMEGYPSAKTYQELALRSGGPKLASFTKWILVVNLFGTTVAYMVVIATIIPAAIEAMVPGVSASSWYLQRWFVLLLVVAIFEVPLGLMKQLNALRYTALIAIFWSIYLTVVTVTEYFGMCDDNDPDAAKCFASAMKDPKILWGPATFQGFTTTLPMIIYSYTCQANVLPIYLEMNRPSPERMLFVTKCAFTVCILVYLTIGLFGYLTFPDDIMGDYLLNNYRHHAQVLAGGFGLVVSVAFCIPLFVHAGRFNIMGRKKERPMTRDEYQQLENQIMDFNQNNPVVHEDDDGNVLNLQPTTPTNAQHCQQVCWCLNREVMHVWVTLLWLGLAYGIACTVDNIAIVIGILGSEFLIFFCFFLVIFGEYLNIGCALFPIVMCSFYFFVC